MSRFYLELDYSIINKNYAFAKKKLQQAKNLNIIPSNSLRATEITAVLKANAGGLGIRNVAPMMEDLGITTYFVATIQEGIALRYVLKKATIYILTDDWTSHVDTLNDYNLSPIVNSAYELPYLKGTSLTCGIHINTGINRLGLQYNEWKPFLQNPLLLNQYPVSLLMSHLAKTSMDNDFDKRQLLLFHQLTQSWPAIPKSLSASKGLYLPKDYHFHMIRLGSALLGHAPLKYSGTCSPLTLKTKILKIFPVQAEEQVGYDGASLAKEKIIAILALGTQDGFPAIYGSILQNFFVPLQIHLESGEILKVRIISLSMDVIHIDITSTVSYFKPLDWVTLFIPSQGISPLAKTLSSIGFHIADSAIATKFYIMGYREKRHIKGLSKPYMILEKNLYPSYK